MTKRSYPTSEVGAEAGRTPFPTGRGQEELPHVQGPSSSGVWRVWLLRLITFPVPAAQFSECTAGAPCQVDGDCPGPQEVLAKKPACSLGKARTSSFYASPYLCSPFLLLSREKLNSGFVKSFDKRLEPAFPMAQQILAASTLLWTAYQIGRYSDV
ncbi:hypothetical protein MG293_000866 [Ovis ammon polii]|uniref:Uncharacterized protein n=1 Tax=Ovis ammon polii TaxID=230172 RepID=A0AAD4UNN3_OVIAM|nr:hypothetical protein MG293_000866 [Ovis ammon polii]